MMQKLILVFLIGMTGAFLPAYGQTDTLFWFVVPVLKQVSPPNMFDRPAYFRISTYGQPATVTISQPAGGGMPVQTVAIPANSTQSIDMTSWVNVIANGPPNTVLDYGLKISATAPVTIYYDVVGQTFDDPEIFGLKGRNALGTDFWIPGQNYLNSETGAYSAFDIVATEHATTVTITPAQNITGHTAGAAFTVTLNEGQTYSAAASGLAASQHLQGSRVTSDKPVAITVKDDRLLGTPFGCGADLAGDQIVPVNMLGTEYVAMKGLLSNPGDQLFILATQNGTTVSQNGTLVTTINAGQTYQVAVGGASTYIQTSLPAYVWQLSGQGCEVGAGQLPQVSCTGSSSVSYVRSSNVSLYLNVMVRNGGQGDFLVNGSASVLTAGMFSAVPGTGGQWMAAQVSLPLAQYPQGSVVSVVNTSAVFHLGVLDGGPTGGISYGYFSNFGSVQARAGSNAVSGRICAGDSIILLADTVTGGTYRWRGPAGYSSSVQNPVIASAATANSGVYTLTVDQVGCASDSDTVRITVVNPPVVDLGPDKTLCADSVLLSSSGSYTSPSYLWNNGQTQPALQAKQSGSYWLQVTDQGCSGSDTVQVTLNQTLTVNLGNDTSLCDKDIPLVLSSPQPSGTQYLWSTGLTTSTIDVTRTDTYWLEATLGDCKGSDTITVQVIPTPSIHIGNDSFICTGQPVNIGDVIPGATYLWNTGSTSSSIEVSESGSYWLTADLEGCKVSDTVQITVTPLPEPDLGKDGDICPEQVIVLDGSDPYDPSGNYRWNTGDTTSSLSVREAGTYWVEVTSPYRCKGYDTVTFTYYPLPVVSLGADTTVCEEQPLTLKPFFTNSDSLLWPDGSMGQLLTVNQGGIYTVTGINKCGSARDTIMIRQIFCDIWLPNAFTPNGDGTNDVFRVLGNVGRLEDFRLRVFNRWGQVVFETIDKYKSWDGRQSGIEAALGVYVYMLEYSLNDQPVLQKGNFTLLR